jgi:CRP/FNR family transcriptional regulator, cyclic AMP receptor protein
MPCSPDVLQQVPLFAGLDPDEASVLAEQVEIKHFLPRQRIYKMGDPGGRGYILVSGRVRITTIDDDKQEVIVDEPVDGEFFGFASMLEQKPHQTEAMALEETKCIEVDRHDILVLLQRKPHAGMDMLAVLGHQFHAAQQLVRVRALRHPNEIIDEEETVGERMADSVASFGGSWKFIVLFMALLSVYTTANVLLSRKAWDPYPFILLNLFLSMLAAIQAPVIMMSQNRQDKKDRLRGELDYDVNRRAHAEIQGLAHKLNLLGDRLGDIEDLLRDQRLPARD